ncbi:MAG TPA: M20 family metallo-hydrolase [Azospirillaceae bacterium]|nr:M20 family metallo-hydrolase [Azospirillaceae bacterium]
MSVADAVNTGRLWRRHMDMAQIGALPNGGVNRPALSPLDAAARLKLVEWGRALGLSAAQDPIGNLFLRRPGRLSRAPVVLTGSHLDTQPKGGKFDGAYGVLAGLEALQAMDDAGVETRRPIELVAWTNEEGARFQPGCAGSAAFAGLVPLERLLAAVDRDGVVVRDALATVLASQPDLPIRALGQPVHAYLEAHIEQGPRLEREGCAIGVVTAIQGARWFAVEVTGEEAHAGTTPEVSRRDALVAALEMVAALRRVMHDPDDAVRFTVGRFDVRPGAPNTIPGQVFFTIDFRHPDAATLGRLGDQVEEVCRRHAGPCAVTVVETDTSPPVVFDAGVMDRIRAAAVRLGLPSLDMPSGAGHDARSLAALCPTGMIFVPCERGISHNEAESAAPEDLAAGAKVLAEVLVELAE